MGNYFPLILLLISVFAVITSAKTIRLPSEHKLKLSPGCPAPDFSLNDRPVIGIVSHPGDGASGSISNATGVSYIAASNVKFVESAGARVIPLIYNEPKETLLEKLELVNGIVFPGGSFEKGEYLERLDEILGIVLENNDAGDNFPLLAINLGFQLLTIIVSQDKVNIEKFSASNQASTLQLVEGLNVEGTLFQKFPHELLEKLGEDCLVMQNHKLSADCPAIADLNYEPVIGIVSHPGDGAGGRISNATGVSYIAASYVKFIESAGARVIPLIYNDPQETLLKKLDLVNGVVFPGGSNENDGYVECLGDIYGGNVKLEEFSASNQASKLQLVEGLDVKGALFERLPHDVLEKLGEKCLIMQNHKLGVSPESFQADESLSNFFHVLTTSPDRDNKVYVSTIQAKYYPILAVQWSPEKNAYEWSLSGTPRTADAILVSQTVANYFVNEARYSFYKAENEQDVRDNLIYNYNTSNSGKYGSDYVEVYIFS
nr:gamma-glutamyl hydrolase 2-like isoform X1 [Ipomoea trifida]